MITKTKVSNFRHLKDIEVPLGRLNLIVGPNGCGKSTFLNSFVEVLTSIRTGALGPESREVSAEFSFSGTKTETGKLVVASGKVQEFSCDFEGKTLNADPITSGAADDLLPSPVMPVKFDIAAMRRPVPASNDQNSFALDGSNLTAAIANAKLNDYSVFEKIRRDLQVVVPAITDIKVSLTNGYFNLKFDTKTVQNLDVKFMSDGTLFTLGLLTFLHMVGGNNALFLIDDLDQGLHPLAQKELVSLLRSILEVNEEYQILATTHSPYLLACMHPDEVLCMHLGDDGLSRMAPLTAHPDFDRWKDEMNPGEFWSLFGDEWVATKGEV
jgi:predicted ATPase